MSKKVKCIECNNMMNWSLPAKVTKDNIDYAKHCLMVAKRSIVCGETMKTKSVSNEQYCNKFKKLDDFKSKISYCYISEIEKLETMINDYDRTIN